MRVMLGGCVADVPMNRWKVGHPWTNFKWGQPSGLWAQTVAVSKEQH